MKLADLVVSFPAGQRKKVAVPMANNEEIIHCIDQAMRTDLADFILIGEKEKITEIARKHQVELAGAQLIEESDAAAACQIAVEQVRTGQADLLMKGLVQTSTFTRAILNREAGLFDKGQLISHVSFFEIPGFSRLVLLTDAGINIEPGLEEKKQILKNALGLARKMGITRPKVACLSAVEKVSPKIRSTVEAEQLANLGAAGIFGDAIVEGPLSLDAAVSRQSARIKGIESVVSGDVDILLAPNIDAANVLYKCLTKLVKANVAGTVAGVNVPVVMTSRADSEETKLLSLALGVKLAC